jgi:hypothetical protein
MSRYFLHLHECGTTIPDLEGLEFSSVEEARLVAIDNARDVMVGEVRAGRLCLGCYISIENDAAEEIARVNFRDALTVTGVPA